MVERIGAIGAVNANAASQFPTGRGIYVVKSGQTVYSIAKEFGMKADEFQKWAGLKSTSLKPGQEITLPTATVPDGKGIYAWAAKYKMSMDDFCKMNGITKSYQAKKGEKFYVKQGGLASSAASSASSASGAASSAPVASSGKTIKASDGKTYPVLEVPECGYFSGDSKNPNVSRGSSAWPPVPMQGSKVVAEVIMFAPQKKGDLSGHTIVVNAGHGWGGSSTPTFKPGTRHKDANGKTLEEWYKNRNLADEVIKNLTARGAKVVYTTGDAMQVCNAKEKFGGDLLISLHCDASSSSASSGLKMVYHKDNLRSKSFAIEVDNQISRQYDDDCKTVDDTQTAHKYIGLIDEDNRRKIPAVLCEMGFMSNSHDIQNIDSKAQQQKAAEALGDACAAYLK